MAANGTLLVVICFERTSRFLFSWWTLSAPATTSTSYWKMYVILFSFNIFRCTLHASLSSASTLPRAFLCSASKSTTSGQPMEVRLPAQCAPCRWALSSGPLATRAPVCSARTAGRTNWWTCVPVSLIIIDCLLLILFMCYFYLHVLILLCFNYTAHLYVEVFCAPLQSQNVWAAIKPIDRNVTRANRSVIIVTAKVCVFFTRS